MKRYVLGFIFPPDNRRVVLVRKRTKSKDGMRWMDGLLNGIGGSVEPAETHSEAMVRECLEESGMLLRWEHVADVTDGSFSLHVYRANMSYPQVLPDENDVGEQYEVHSIADVIHQHVLIVPNLQWLVPMCLGADRPFWPFHIHQRTLEQANP